MAHWLTQVVLKRQSNVPEDDVVNTYHWDVDVTDELAQSEAVGNLLESFYQTIDAYLSTFIAGTGNVVKFFDMADPEPRVPFRTREIDLSGADFGTGLLPAECAICLSFQAPPASGVNQARRRGRVYLGPISSQAVTGGASDVRIPVTVRENILDAFQFTVASAAASGAELCVYSRASDSLAGVEQLWIDNAVDIQRRRGTRPSERSVFP